MAGQGTDHATMAAVLGHKRQSMTDRHVHPSLRSQQKTIRHLETFCLGIDGFLETFPISREERLVSGF